MIAANHMKHIEALRFQHEMFFNGYKNQPRFMRLMQCIFNQEPNTPTWFKTAKAQARALAKAVEKAILPMFDGRGGVTWTFKKIERLEDVEGINNGQISRLKRAGIQTPHELVELNTTQFMGMTRSMFNQASEILTRLKFRLDLEIAKN
jgi:hypothetical protein